MRWSSSVVGKISSSTRTFLTLTFSRSRYGGIMLGPVRFTHIQDCAREVCKTFRVEDEMQDCISTLQSLDDILADLRGELAKIKDERAQSGRGSKSEAGSRDPTTRKDYATLRKNLDIPKARRQISARERAIDSVKKLINEQREASSSVFALGESLHGIAATSSKVADSCSGSYLMYTQLLLLAIFQVLNSLLCYSLCNSRTYCN